jgi:hypothetical protein
LTSEQVITKYYASGQEPDESIAAWGCHIAVIIIIELAHAEAMLRQKFWLGLRVDEIKEATQHRYDTGADFNSLLVACRAVEQETGSKPKKQVS